MLSKPAPDYKVSDEIRVSHRDESFNLHMWNEVRGLDPYQRSRLTDAHFRILRSEHPALSDRTYGFMGCKVFAQNLLLHLYPSGP